MEAIVLAALELRVLLYPDPPVWPVAQEVLWRNRSFLGILPIWVWKTNNGLPIPNLFSFPFQRRSTNAFLLHCSSSRCMMLANLCSSSSHRVANRIASDSFSFRRSRTCMRKLGTWNSIGIIASNPNANRNGVVRMLVLYVVRYAQSALCSLVSQSVRFSLTIFRRMFCSVLFVDWANPLACGQ